MPKENMKQELEGLVENCSNKVKEITFNYPGKPCDLRFNRLKAIEGVSGGILLGQFLPIAGLAVTSYGGVKAYQTYKDWRAQNGR